MVSIMNELHNQPDCYGGDGWSKKNAGTAADAEAREQLGSSSGGRSGPEK